MHALNYDWTFKYDEIICIAFGEAMIIDDDENFILFLTKNKRPIQFIIPSIGSEEMYGIVDFINKLKEEFDLNEVDWVLDKTIIAYPQQLHGKELYGFWKGSLIKLISGLAKLFGRKYEYDGVIRDSLNRH